MNTEVIVLLVYILIREIMTHIAMQKLVNKLMSRDYNTYKYSEEAYKQQPVNSIPVPQDVPADLGVLRDFQDSLI